MIAGDAAAADRELAEVVLRRFGPTDSSPLLVHIVTALARAVREDHAAMDLARRDDDHVGSALENPDAVLDALRATPTLCQFLRRDDPVEASGPPLVVLDDRFLSLRRWALAEWRVARSIDEARATVLEVPDGLTRAAVEAAITASTTELARRVRRR